MNFIRETGAILSPNRQILHLVDGSATEVVFPQKLTWDLHRASQGCVYAFTHIHPPGMTELSGEDKSTAHAWTVALHPFPFRMITITQINSPNGLVFAENCYLSLLEAKETWEKDKSAPRKFKIIHESEEKHFAYIQDDSEGWYGHILIQKSYEFPKRQRINSRYQIDSRGYKRIFFPDFPHSYHGGMVREHRLKMEEMIGRKLNKNEVVHHINGVKNDNRSINLALLLDSAHKSYHMSGMNHPLYGTIPWNKGLTKKDPRVQKYLRPRTRNKQGRFL